ncbi:MAG TPA: SIR2 family protein [Thermodesulfobacteriota bacterium]|nr:SIR2 family protein [Thermodesulfobacteriota bacterium]
MEFFPQYLIVGLSASIVDMTMSNKTIPRILTNAIFERRLIVVVGSGVSRFSAGCPLWSTLIDGLRHDLLADHYIDQSFTGDNLDLAQLYEIAYGRSSLGQRISNMLKPTFTPTHDIYKAIVKLNPRIIITTNYDKLLESALDQMSFQYHLAVQNTNLTEWNSDKLLLLKVHGDINDYKSLIVTKEDYATFSRRFFMLTQFLSQQYAFNSILYLGFSFTDPNFQNLHHQLTWDLWDDEARKSSLKKSFLLTAEISKGFERILQHERIDCLLMSNYNEIVPYLEKLSYESNIRTLRKETVRGCDGIDDYAAFTDERLSAVQLLGIETELFIPAGARAGTVLSLLTENDRVIVSIQFQPNLFASGVDGLVLRARTHGNNLRDYRPLKFQRQKWTTINLVFSPSEIVFETDTGQTIVLDVEISEPIHRILFATSGRFPGPFLNCMFSFFAVKDLATSEVLLDYDCNIPHDSQSDSVKKQLTMTGLWVSRI